jgi:aspartate kinase
MVVMKFGGSSVQNAESMERVAELIRRRMRRRPVVVVSAFAGVTDRLLALGRVAASGQGEEALTQVRSLQKHHHDMTRNLLGEGGLYGSRLKLQPFFEELERFVAGLVAIRELSPRSTDSLMAWGELFSSHIITAALQARGLPACWVDSRECIITDEQFTQAVPDYAETYSRIRTRVRPLLIEGQLPVMAGFIAATREGAVSTLGRRGSDLSAALIAAGVNAARIEIWSTVDGIMSADPAICPQARCLRRVSFREAAEMAYFGAKVLHPATLIPAMEKNIPVYVLNSRNPLNPGTEITARPPRGRSLFTAVAARKDVSIVTLSAPRESSPHLFLQEVFHVLHRHACVADLVAVSEPSVSFALRSSRKTTELLANLRHIGAVSVEDKQAIVCLVGENIRGRAGIAARCFTALADAGINVRLISQGASEISLSFVIQESDTVEAVQRLHARFTVEKQSKLRSPAEMRARSADSTKMSNVVALRPPASTAHPGTARQRAHAT